VRTYVKTAHRAGVWFFSLDAANWLAVRAARLLGIKLRICSVYQNSPMIRTNRSLAKIFAGFCIDANAI